MIINSKKENGFTLIEVMVSLLLFALGMLGVALQLAKGASLSTNNDIHSGAMQVAMQAVEPLKMAVKNDKATFQTALQNIGTSISSANFESNNSTKKSMSINISSAVDINKQNILAADIETWRPPYSIVVEVSYLDTESGSVESFYTTYVLYKNGK